MGLFLAQSDESADRLGRVSGVHDTDMAWDMLVDDELPEEQRRELLKTIEKTPDGWRRLALHFLARQVERRAVREMLEGRTAARPAVLYRIDWVRVAAMVMIAAGLFGAAGLYLGRGGMGIVRPVGPGGSNPQVAVAPVSGAKQGTIQYITPGLPPGFGTQEPQELIAPSLNTSAMQTTAYPEADHIVLVPEGPDHVMAYPVVPINGKKQTIY
ncbi:MAG: hypothetical protein ACP5VQ_04555 [Phycisphaerae bacterium]